MRITISPCAGAPGQIETPISVASDVVVVDGVEYDFSSLAEGGVLEIPESPFSGFVARQDGVVCCTVRLLYDPLTAEADQPLEAGHWTVDVISGPLPDLIVRREEQPRAAAD